MLKLLAKFIWNAALLSVAIYLVTTNHLPVWFILGVTPFLSMGCGCDEQP